MPTKLPAATAAPRQITDDRSKIPIEDLAIRQLEQHPYFRGRGLTIDVEYRSGTLILRGRLPSFHLKQMLQEVLRHVDGVKQIDNRVDVVCPHGLSSQGEHEVLSQNFVAKVVKTFGHVENRNS
jgi:osmotically-inducible protein OsmY